MGPNGADVGSGTAGNGVAGTVGLKCYGGPSSIKALWSSTAAASEFNAALGGIGGSGGSGGNSNSGTPGRWRGGGGRRIRIWRGIYSNLNSVVITNCILRATMPLGPGGMAATAACPQPCEHNGVAAIGGEGSGAGLCVSAVPRWSTRRFLLQIAGGGNGGNNGYTYAVSHDGGPAGGNSYGGAIFNAGTNNTVLNCTFDETVSSAERWSGEFWSIWRGGTGGAGVCQAAASITRTALGSPNCTLVADAAIEERAAMAAIPSGANKI